MNDDTSLNEEKCHSELAKNPVKTIKKSFEHALSNRKNLITGFFAGSE